MAVRKIDTVTITKVNRETGKVTSYTYSKVVARIREFVESAPRGDIQTTVEFKEGYALFVARVRPDVDTTRVFTGHALGKISSDKAFEKLETVAVGRALSFAGYLPTGEIASCEEMENFIANGGTVEGGEAFDRLDEIEAEAKQTESSTESQRTVLVSAKSVLPEKITKRDVIDWCVSIGADLSMTKSASEVDNIMAVHAPAIARIEKAGPQKLGVEVVGALTALRDAARVAKESFSKTAGNPFA